MPLHPYLYFTNNTREAMTCYQEILGGQLDILGLDDIPSEDAEEMSEMSEMPEGFVMHAALVLPDGGLLMASDDPSGDGAGVTGMSINLMTQSQDDARRFFDALAEGGEVGMPLGPQFWSPLFGTLRDRFGVNWLVNVDTGEAG